MSESVAECPPPGTSVIVTCAYCRHEQRVVVPDDGVLRTTHHCSIIGDWPAVFRLTWIRTTPVE